MNSETLARLAARLATKAATITKAQLRREICQLCDYAYRQGVEDERNGKARDARRDMEREAAEGGLLVPDDYQPTWRKQA